MKKLFFSLLAMMAIATSVWADGGVSVPKYHYYRIKSQHGWYLQDSQTNGYAALSNTEDINSIYYLDGKYNLKNYETSTYTNCPSSVMQKEGTSWTFAEGTTSGYLSLKANDGEYLSDKDAATNKYCSQSTSKDDNCNWTMEDVTSIPVSISAAGYATVNFGIPTIIPDGITAYYVSGVTSGKLTLVKITDEFLPATIGLILEGTSGTYNFDFYTGYGNNDVSDSKLKIAYKNETIPSGSYVLGKQDDVVGFYKLGIDRTAKTRCAYLAASDAVGVKSFSLEDAVIEDEATGITETAHFTKQGAIYNLAGQRVSKAGKGVFIINGKKVLK